MKFLVSHGLEVHTPFTAAPEVARTKRNDPMDSWHQVSVPAAPLDNQRASDLKTIRLFPRTDVS